MAKTATATTVRQEDDGPDLRGVLDDISEILEMKKATKEKSSTQGARTKKVCEDRGLNTQAFQTVVTLAEKSDDKLRDVCATLVPLLNDLIVARLGMQHDLFTGGPLPEPTPEAKEAGAKLAKKKNTKAKLVEVTKPE